MRSALTIIASIALLAPGSAFAGGLAEPLVEPEVLEPEVIATQSASSGGVIVPLLLLALLVAVASASGGAAPVPPPPVK